MNDTEETYMMRRVLVIVVALAFVIGVVFLVMWLTGGEEDEVRRIAPLPGLIPGEGFRLTKLIFADSVDEEYTYVENPTATYHIGEDVHLYIELTGYPDYERETGYLVAMSENITTTGPSGIVDTLTGYVIVTSTIVANKDNLYIRDVWDTKSLVPGEYNVDFQFTDEESGESIITTKRFRLE